jgi:hypothetical protein
MDARYQAPAFGRFLSEDPNFLMVGAPDWVTGIPSDPTYAGLAGFVNSGNGRPSKLPGNMVRLGPAAYSGNPGARGWGGNWAPVTSNPLHFFALWLLGETGAAGGVEGVASAGNSGARQPTRGKLRPAGGG